MSTWFLPELRKILVFGGYNLVLAAVMGLGSWYLFRMGARWKTRLSENAGTRLIHIGQVILYTLCTALSGLYALALGQDLFLTGAVNLIAAATVFAGLPAGMFSSLAAMAVNPLTFANVQIAGLGGLLLLPLFVRPFFRRGGGAGWLRQLWPAAVASLCCIFLNARQSPSITADWMDFLLFSLALLVINSAGYALLYLFIRIPGENRLLIQTLSSREENYRQLLEHAPISLWEEDFSVLAEYIRQHPEEFVSGRMEHIVKNSWRYFSMISILSTNRATLQLLGAENAEELMRRLPESRTPEFTHALAQEIIAVRDGKTFFMTGTSIRNFQGELLNVVLQWSVLPGHETDYRRVLVSIVDITQTAVQARELAFADAQQEQLIGEVHHRVRNSLAIAYSIMGLELEEMESPELRELYASSMNRIQAIALIHTKLYKNDEILAMDLAGYLDDLIGIITSQTSESRISCRLHCPSRTVHIDQVLPLGIMLNEMVINSQKHAFSRDQTDPQIVIRVEFSGNSCSFRYSDNGRGMDPGILDREGGSSLGTSLLNSLALQLGGRLSYNYRDGWSVFLLKFPLEDVSLQEAVT
ncbi:sensor histidine kinase [Salinispira pacifica]|uniref:histidine kinase n=1 Tax=Salinispira pacifica TaxID=1307761 RepID=V5WD38_9SPIO|nr:sensor histidine kinase [Salinispira pacifica]AHC13707.1 hypothetical protein L21SP2_0265 [Salinispira pacifica]